MRPSCPVFALVGAALAFGPWQSDLAFAQAAGDNKTGGAPAAVSPPAPAPAPPAAPPSSTPGTPPSPAVPPPPPAASGPAPSATPPAVQTQPAGLVGEEVTLPEQTIVYTGGSATWENALGAIIAGLKKVYAYLEKEAIAPAGPPMTIYTSTDDNGFQFRVAVPVAQAPVKTPEGDVTVGKSPGGKALKYIHHGSYESMDTTYEAITNQLDEKGLDAQDVFVEIYLTDPRSTPEDKLAIEVYVPVK